MWSFFTVQSGIVPNWMGSLMYLPHAARVLMVVYFGWRSIPGLYLAELWGPYYLAEDAYNFALWIPSAISVLSVSVALYALKFFGFPLGTTIQSPLNKRNYKHIGLITMISAFFNALLVNVYLSQIHANFVLSRFTREYCLNLCLVKLLWLTCNYQLALQTNVLLRPKLHYCTFV